MAQGYEGTGSTSRQAGSPSETTAMARLAAGVAHEINNPVGVLMLKLKFLLSIADTEGLSPRAVASLRVAVEQTERIEGIVARLVAFSRPPAGAPRRLPGQVACEQARDQIASRRGPSAAPPVRWEVEAGLPTIQVDPEVLGRILGNLVDNAVQAAGPQGCVTVKARAVAGAHGVQHLELAVTDDGAGIPADYVDHIFDPFFTTRRSGGGTGLGLAVVRSLVQSLGGSVHVDSQRGRGTTMRVRVPTVEGP